MKNGFQETEVKFWVKRPEIMVQKIEVEGGVCVSPRTYEHNLRFDTPEKKLSAAYEVLRLREDREVRLTFKGACQTEDGVAVRQEIEFQVSDAKAARLFLENLGYEVIFVYEKYRTTYEFMGGEVVVDEIPMGGVFVEIEGNSPQVVRQIADALNLVWERRVPHNYQMIFEGIKQAYGLEIRDLVFENFTGLKIDYPRLEIYAADGE
ncbi:MAG: class IV adenylate cyclase [Anaerolineales bacterium]|nr:class IV adenylate cyclase [Anaerolineales bacterium]